MKIDDLKAWILANITPFIAARSTVEIPLSAIVDAQIETRGFSEPGFPVALWLDDPLPEEIAPLTSSTVDVTWRVDAFWIVSRGATEIVARGQTEGYLLALIDCIKTHPDFFEYEGREFFDGFEGKLDIKASKVTLVFRFEE